MNRKVKVLIGLIAIVISAVLLCFLVLSPGTNNNDIKTRTINLRESAVDYASVFNEFDDAELILDSDNNAINFSGTQYLDPALFNEIDLVSISEDDKGLGIKYIFDYNADKNEYFMSIIADTDDGDIVDQWFGVPFVDESDNIDIAFPTDDGIVYLSELEDSGVLENCGWFSNLFKKVAKVFAVVAVVAAVVAVAVVAAPAVAAAATTVGTAIAVGGGTAALTGVTATAAIGAAAAAGAAAIGTTAFVLASTTALIAASAAVTSYLASKVFYSLEEKVKSAARELSRLKEYSGHMIYRADLTGNAYKSLTPRNADISGLSFFNNIPYMFGALVITNGVFITTDSLVSGTGLLKAQKDSTYHYSVTPKTGSMSSWIASYSTAKTNPHKYTLALKEVCFYVPGI